MDEANSRSLTNNKNLDINKRSIDDIVIEPKEESSWLHRIRRSLENLLDFNSKPEKNNNLKHNKNNSHKQISQNSKQHKKVDSNEKLLKKKESKFSPFKSKNSESFKRSRRQDE